jgi:CheY-like chemotaxis protein
MSTKIAAAVASELSAPSQQSVESCLGLVLRWAGAARVSLAVFSASCAEIVASHGLALLADGARVPCEASSLFSATARGTVFAEPDIKGAGGFWRPVDRLMLATGYRSTCSVPLLRGRAPFGALSVSHTGTDAADPDDLTELQHLSSLFSVALARRPAWRSPRVLVCHDSRLTASGIARLLERHAQAQVTTACDAQEAAAADAEYDAVISDVVVFGEPITELRRLCPAVRRSRLIVLSGYQSAAHESLAFEAGALAFMT